jgi:hypothetical protein
MTMTTSPDSSNVLFIMHGLLMERNGRGIEGKSAVAMREKGMISRLMKRSMNRSKSYIKKLTKSNKSKGCCPKNQKKL